MIIFTNFISFSHGFFCNLNYLNSNKQKYYINESIQINASWILDYNQYNEIAYVQIQIFDYFNNTIWNSSIYDEIGFSEKNWDLNIIDLNISFINGNNTLFIKFFSYYYQISTMDMIITYLKTIKVEILKRTLLCKLINFKPNVNIGENLTISVRFYDKLLENNSFLINQSILFNILSNESLIYQSNFITNELGIIKFNILSYDHLELGKNVLVFIVKNNSFYNDSKFFYEIFLYKNLVYIDIIDFKEDLGMKEDLKIKLQFYYFLNKSLNPLNNHSIKVMIFNNKSLTYANNFFTDQFGFLNLSLSQEIFISDENCEVIIIKFFFNGTRFLENKTLSLMLRLNLSTNQNLHNSPFQYNKFLVVISISIILTVFSVALFRYIKKRKEKPLANITVKY
ncbi:MAG: hypothetical protein ACFFHD_07140 [Promethearchaeota archaeon]